MATSFLADSSSSTRFQLWLDRLCRNFERQWRARSPLRIEDCLDDIEPRRRPAVLHELIATELDLRIEAGERPAFEDYLRRFPEAAASIAYIFADASPSAPTAPRGDSIASPVESRAAIPFPRQAAQPVEAPVSQAAARPVFGERLGDYRIIREIGRGGMGIVYEALQTSLNRRVALKILPFAATLNPSGRRRFQQEAFTAAKLKHRNIVSVYDAVMEEAVPYIVMELIEGSSLASWVRRPADSAEDRSVASTECALSSAGPEGDASERLAKIGLDVARALAFAHAHAILHRDVKPSNLLVDASGDVRLADFGLARSLDDEGTTTFTGEFLGTLRYAAPETLQGEFDHRSDIYSLGVTLYELATRAPAFVGATREALLEKIVRGAPAAWPKYAVCRRDLRTIIRKSMAPEPHQRYATAAELAEDLERFLSGRPIRARQPSAYDHVAGWCRRQPLLASLAALLPLTLCLGIAVSLWLWRDAVRSRESMALERSRAVASESLAKTQQSMAEQAARAATLNAAELQHAVAIQAMENRHDGQALIAAAESLRLAEQMVAPGELSGELSGEASGQAAGEASGQAAGWGEVKPGLPLPISNRWILSALEAQLPVPIARASVAERMRLWELLHPSIKIGRELPTVRFTPDGSQILVGSHSGSDVQSWDFVANRQRPLLDQPTLPGVPIQYCGDMRYAVVQRPDRVLELWDVVAQRALHTLEVGVRYHDSLNLLAVWLSPDAQRLLVFAFTRFSGPTYWMYDATRGVRVGDQRPAPQATRRAWFSSDSRHVYLDGKRGQLREADSFAIIDDDLPPDAQPVLTANELVLGLPREIQLRRFDSVVGTKPSRTIPLPEGTSLSVYHFDQERGRLIIGTTNGELLAMTVDPERLEQRASHGTSPISHIVPSPDGRKLLAADASGRVGLWDASLRTFLGNVVEHREELASVAWSPDSRVFATATARGELAVWRRPEERQTLDTAVSLVEMSPDQEHLLLAYHDGRMAVRKLSTGRVWRKLPAAAGKTTIAVWGPRSDRIAFATDAVDSQAAVWVLGKNDKEDGERAGEISGEKSSERDGERDGEIDDERAEEKHDEKMGDKAGDNSVAYLRRLASQRTSGLCFTGDGSRVVVHAGPQLAVFTIDPLFKADQLARPFASVPVMLGIVPGPTPQHLHLLADNTSVIGCLSPALANHDKALHYWDPIRGNILYERNMPLGRVTHQLVLAPDGQTLLAVGDYGLLVWKTTDGLERAVEAKSVKFELLQVVCHPTAALAATIGRDQVVRCFNYRTGDLVGQPIRCPGNLLKIAWSPDGRALQSVSATSGLQLWDWGRGEPLSPPFHLAADIKDARFSAPRNQWFLLMAGESGDVIALQPPMPSDRPVADWIDRARFLTGFEVSPSPRQPWAHPANQDR